MILTRLHQTESFKFKIFIFSILFSLSCFSIQGQTIDTLELYLPNRPITIRYGEMIISVDTLNSAIGFRYSDAKCYSGLNQFYMIFSNAKVAVFASEIDFKEWLLNSDIESWNNDYFFAVRMDYHACKAFTKKYRGKRKLKNFTLSNKAGDDIPTVYYIYDNGGILLYRKSNLCYYFPRLLDALVFYNPNL
jgi:hypothetical protein